MPSLPFKSLASTLATRLEGCRWTEDDVARLVRNYLPVDCQRDADPLTQSLMARFPQRYAPDANRLTDMLLEQPGMSRLFKYCTKVGDWPSFPLEPARMQPVPPFDDLDLPALHTVGDLADWLLLTPDQLDAYVDRIGWREAHPMPGVKNYFYRISPKSRGGVRLIEAPKPRLKTLQRLIYRQILAQVPVHPNSFGFVRGRDCIQAAQKHAGEEVVISLDLKNYFSNLRYGRVYALFRYLGYPVSVAHSLSGLCTVITPSHIRRRMPFDQRQALLDPHLPQGAPSSPVLANLLSYRLDRRLTGLAGSLGANYTRYADDLIFSGDNSVRDAVLVAAHQIVEEEGFKIRPDKTKVMKRHQRQMILGIVVNETITISRTEFDRLKAVIHNRTWKNDPAKLAQIIGQIGWVAKVNPSKGQNLYARLERAHAEASAVDTSP